jgi:hypothetical protein
MAADSWIWVLIPLAWALVVGMAISAYFRFKAASATATVSAANDFQKVAQEAVRTQQETARALSDMVASLKQIEKVLTEV